MSLPGAFSDCKRFWSVQLNGVYNSTRTQKKVKVDSDTQLHISNAIVDFGCLSHQAHCSVSIGVTYETDRCGCDVTKQSCGLHPQQQQSCVLCIIKPEKKSEADLDLNFLGQKDLTFYYSCYCDCDCNYQNRFTVNISGYQVRG